MPYWVSLFLRSICVNDLSSKLYQYNYELGGKGFLELPEVISLDTGGTMTDSFLVSSEGNFTVGKAPTTPEDESEGIFNSTNDALKYWDTSLEESAESVEALVYSGTAMLNRLIEREGNDNIGLITNAGFEDLHRMGRAIQGWVGLDYAGRLHAREHNYPEPLIPRDQIKGVRGRINFWGDEIVPLYEDEAKSAVEDLLDMGVDSICVCFLCSYMNSDHEDEVKRIAVDLIEERGEDCSVVISSEHNPVRGETPRINTLLVEQYAAEPSREQMIKIRDSLQEAGVPAPLRVLTSYGGTVSPHHDQLVSTLVSGPIGGVVGGKHIADLYDIENLVCTDVGGTSFDLALVTDKYVPTRWESALAKFMLNIPMMAMDSIGAGTGMYVSYDKVTKRLEFGPESAGYLVGVCNEDADVDTVTMTDCSLILGYLNPDYFLGGDMNLSKERALEAIEEQLANPMGEDPYVTARGALDLIDTDMQNQARGIIEGLGFRPENYTLLSYGGGGPLHVAGYTRDLDFEDIMVPSWAAAFSAFGCACGDYSYRHEKTMDLMIKPDGSMNPIVASMLTAQWEELRGRIADEFERDGRDPEEMEFRPSVKIQYYGMLDDLKIESPSSVLEADDVWDLAERYDERFEEIYRRGTKSPHLGYHITKAIGVGVAPVTKPKVPEAEPSEMHHAPPEEAAKGEREIFWDDEWFNAQIWEMGELLPGNSVDGPAVIEAPATTLLVPPDLEAELDKHEVFHLEEKE